MEEKAEVDDRAMSPSFSGEKSDSGQDPSDSHAPDGDPEIFRQDEEESKKEYGEEDEKEEEKEEQVEDAEIFHPSKRRKKNCPASLEKSLSSNRGFSFSFDTKTIPIESTPKFGSFNLELFGGSDCEGIGLGLGIQEKRGEEAVSEAESVKAGEGSKGGMSI